MIILNDKLNKDVREKIKKIIPEDSLVELHGTFASGKSKYVSDVDLELLIYIENINPSTIKKYVKTIQDIIQSIKSNKDIFLTDTIIGIDHRFDIFDIYIKEDFTFDSYDNVKFIKEIKALFKSNVINKEEKTHLLSIIKKNPTNMDGIELKLLIEDEYKFINWGDKEILKGTKTHRNKVFKLEDVIIQENFPSIITTIFKIDENIYVPVDMSIICHNAKDLNLEPQFLKVNNNRYHKIQKKLLTEIDRYEDIHRFFFGVFKNYFQKKWMKCLKRLRTILTRFFYKDGDYYRYKTYIDKVIKDRNKIHRIRREISDLTNTELGILNQLKNQFSTIIDLLDHLKIKEIVRLLDLKINDIEKCSQCYSCSNEHLTILKGYIKEKKINKTKLKELIKNVNKTIMNCMNRMAYPLFVKYYNECKEYLPFELDFEKDFINI